MSVGCLFSIYKNRGYQIWNTETFVHSTNELVDFFRDLKRTWEYLQSTCGERFASTVLFSQPQELFNVYLEQKVFNHIFWWTTFNDKFFNLRVDFSWLRCYKFRLKVVSDILLFITIFQLIAQCGVGTTCFSCPISLAIFFILLFLTKRNFMALLYLFYIIWTANLTTILKCIQQRAF